MSSKVTANAVYAQLAKAMKCDCSVVDIDDFSKEDKVTPRELRDFLAKLRLLQSVPFNNIVPDSELLPIESIRFFYVDRAWTDAITQGALSVGTVNSSDRTQLERLYPEIEREIDAEERLVRLPGGEDRQKGGAGLMTGFLMRSRAVSGWPGLHVRAYKSEAAQNDEEILPETHPDRLKLLRLERLAPAVMLALFDGLPEVVHIEEPRQGLQFGVSLEPVPNNFNTYRASVPARNVATATYVNSAGETVDDDGDPLLARDAHRLPVSFRPGAPGVLDLANTSRTFLNFAPTGMKENDGLVDGAEFALEMIRFPYRQVFGDSTIASDPNILAVFRPTLGLALSELTQAFKGRL